VAITVYWASLEPEWMRVKKPESVFKSLMVRDKNTNVDMNLCPSIKDFLNNYYGLRSIYNYSFDVLPDKSVIPGDLEDSHSNTNEFARQHLSIRSAEQKLYSFQQKIIFFTEEDSLLMSLEYPFLEDNNITERCMIIPGQFDIGKWLRPIEFAFYLKEKHEKFIIKYDEIYAYLKFHTDEKIEFKEFMITPTLYNHVNSVISSKHPHIKRGLIELPYYYSIFKQKKNVLKEIKNNLL
jgi:hypothetical protein